MVSGQMRKRYPDKNNVLLVNITRLGDMLQATPTIAGMKMENPDCKITVLVEKQFESVCHSIPNIDEVVAIDLGMTVRSLAREQDGIVDAYEYLDEFVEDLKSRNFDYSLNMSSSAYTAILLQLLNIPKRGGWSSDDQGYRLIESHWAQLFATSVFHQNRQYNSLNLVDVFRCSADVEMHPEQLLIDVQDEDEAHCHKLIEEAKFTNTGPLVVLQAGASQAKRQWAPANFVRLIKLLVERDNARVVLSGTKKELSIIEPIKQACESENVLVVAGKTNIPQLAALLRMSDILITGDTGPMHMAVAVGTPVVSMFLASAYGYETGPYSSGNIILQPVLGCGPCNPNKSCARPDCHDHISPELMAELASMRLKEDFTSLPEGLADPNRVVVYRSYFDEYGFCDLKALNVKTPPKMMRYRNTYRKLWLNDIGGYTFDTDQKSSPSLQVFDQDLEGLEQVVMCAQKGQELIQELQSYVRDASVQGAKLGEVAEKLTAIDHKIEQLGFHYSHLGPLTRMFVFAKENLSGSDALELASEMGRVYEDLERRGGKFNQFYYS